MNDTQRKRLSKDELALILRSQIGQPSQLPEDTLKNIIKDTIEKTIEEKIPDNLADMFADMKKNFTEKLDTITNENRILKKTILEQQKFLEGMRREKMKTNIFISGLPESCDVGGVTTDDQPLIIKEVFSKISTDITDEHYTVSKTFQPTEGRTRFSAKITFNNVEMRMNILKNCKNLGKLAEGHALKKVFIKSEAPPLTRKENKRLADKMWTLRRAEPPGSTIKYILSKGKLLKDDQVIDEFDLGNQIFC